MSRRAFALGVVGIAVVALVARVAYVQLVVPRAPLGYDGAWYGLQAGAIGAGLGYIDPRRFYSYQGAFATAQFPPLWPALLSLVYDVGLGGTHWYRMAGGPVGTATVVMTALIGRRVASARVGLVAAAVVALSPFMIAADGSLMAESLFIALVTAAVLAALWAIRSPGFGPFAVMGLLLGLATLTRSDGLIIAVILVGVTAWRSPAKVTRRVGLAVATLLVFVVVLVPWTVRNSDALGEPVPLSGNSGSLLAGANCAAVYGGAAIGTWSGACASAPKRPGNTEIEDSNAERRAGLRYLRDHAGRAAVVVPVRIVRGWGIWNPVAQADAEANEGRNRTFQIVAWGAELVLLGAAVVGAVLLVRARGPGDSLAPLFAVIGAATVVLASSWGNQRFRLVAEPALAVFAAAAVVTLWDRIRGPASEGVSV